ncbi:31206_t:CDS:1, partial [Racocetra persica]
MPHGRPSFKDVCLQFIKVTGTDKHGQKTPRQMCIHCEEDIIDINDRLKDHLMKCKNRLQDIKDLLNFTTSKYQKNISITDLT